MALPSAPISAGQFRTDFPEFNDAGAYPDSQINMWLNIAAVQVSQRSWGILINLGLELYAAHNIVLERQSMKSAARNAPPGVTRGPISSEGVDGASVSYGGGSAMTLENGGDWNATVYGLRFLKMRRELGTGGMVV